MKASMVLMLINLFAIVGSAGAQEATSTPETETSRYPFTFPLTISEAQVDEAYACPLQLETDATDTPERDTPDAAFACITAREALQYAQIREPSEAVSAEERTLLLRVVEENPALLLRLDMIYAYYNSTALVEPPLLAQQPIAEVDLFYTFNGIGNTLRYDIQILDADTMPMVSGTIENDAVQRAEADATAEASQEPLIELLNRVDREIVQALGSALSDFIPVEEQFTERPCWDYYPNWVVTLTFEDGSEIEMRTNSSNVAGIGGPWQAEIEGQDYYQYSAAFSAAIANLLQALELPLGETMAMGCGDLIDPLLSAYPQSD